MTLGVPYLTSYVKMVSLKLEFLQLYLGGITESRGQELPYLTSYVNVVSHFIGV